MEDDKVEERIFERKGGLCVWDDYRWSLDDNEIVRDTRLVLEKCYIWNELRSLLPIDRHLCMQHLVDNGVDDSL